MFFHVEANPLPCNFYNDFFYRIPLSTVPRSGNTMLRRLIEYATLVSTEHIFPNNEGGLYSNRTGTYGYAHGIVEDTRVRRSCGNDAAIIKTHYPFQPQFLQGCISASITIVRHPVDNWIAYLMDMIRTGKVPDIYAAQLQLPFWKFHSLWKKHHRFWLDIRKEMRIPIVTVRYEDLCRYPAWIVSRVLPTLGISKSDRLQYLNAFASQHCLLRNFQQHPEVVQQLGATDKIAQVQNGTVENYFGYGSTVR